MKKFLVNSIFMLACFFGVSQQQIDFTQAEALYKKVDQFYAQQKYNIQVQMRSYKGSGNTNLKDEFTGYVRKNNHHYETYQLGQYSIQNKELKVVVDSAEQLVAITFPDKSIGNQFSRESFLSSQLHIEKVLFTKQGKQEVYTTHYKSGYYFSKVQMHVLPTGQIKQVKMFLAKEIAYEDKDKQMQKAEAWVDIKFKLLPISTTNFFDLSMEAIVKKNKDGFVLTDQFKNFQLTDLRYKQ